MDHNLIYITLIKRTAISFFSFYLVFCLLLSSYQYPFWPTGIIWLGVLILALLFLFLDGRNHMSLMKFYIHKSVSLIPAAVLFVNTGVIIVDYINHPRLMGLFWGCITIAPIVMVFFVTRYVKKKFQTLAGEEMEKEILTREFHHIEDIPITKDEVSEKYPKASKWLKFSPFVASLSLFTARNYASLSTMIVLVFVTLFAQAMVAGVFGCIPYIIALLRQPYPRRS